MNSIPAMAGNFFEQLNLEYWPIDRLIPYARNPRKNDEVVDRMVGAIREFGFRIPIVARSDGTVVDGHLRLKAARRLGMEEVPVVLADDLSDVKIKAFRILTHSTRLLRRRECADCPIPACLQFLAAADELRRGHAGNESKGLRLDGFVE